MGNPYAFRDKTTDDYKREYDEVCRYREVLRDNVRELEQERDELKAKLDVAYLQYQKMTLDNDRLEAEVERLKNDYGILFSLVYCRQRGMDICLHPALQPDGRCRSEKCPFTDVKRSDNKLTSTTSKDAKSKSVKGDE